jgi:peptidoglycan/LPS O-acetylase OafA/YrhL
MFYTNIGEAGVTLFFMITGYLFWTQILKAEGRPNFLKLYIGRVFRIVPLYLFLAILVFFAVGILTHWRLQVSPSKLVRDIFKWLSGGILVANDVNGYAHTDRIAAGVTWTLQFEWYFYASLLLTAFLARNPVLRILLPIAGFLSAGLLTALYPTSMNASAAAMFCVGMIAALAKSSATMRHVKAPQWAISTMIAILVTLVLSFSTRVYGIVSIMALGFAFFLVVLDGTIFGLLLTRGARRLGDISYGIYLLQGPVLFLVFWPSVVRADALASPWFHWGVVLVAALLLVALATAAHVLIEKPGVGAGRWVASRVLGIRRLGLASSPQHS